MCGIFGYVHYQCTRSTREVLRILLDVLKRLEYRGYDSAGVCFDNKGESIVIREVGNIDLLSKACFDNNIRYLDYDEKQKSGVAIAHTRWATHGSPCEKNAHPISSKNAEFIICHNGIMTNYGEVKILLMKHGYEFVSDTDTEVIAQLFHYVYHSTATRPSMPLLVKEVLRFIEGTYALLIKSKFYPDEIAACRKGSPLIVSTMVYKSVTDTANVNDVVIHEVFFSSDPTALAGHATHAVYLVDGDIAHFSNAELKYYTNSTQAAISIIQSREIVQLEVELGSFSKGNFPHYMLKEIYDQRESVLSAMRGRIDFGNKEIKMNTFKINSMKLQRASRLIFISCGTSFYACMAIRPLFDELTEKPVMLESASDFLDRAPFVCRSDVCIFVSQSGETADSLRALEFCKEHDAVLIGVTNVVGSAIARATDFGAYLYAGSEICVASTKAFTSQIVVMTLLALCMATECKKLENRKLEIINGLSTLTSNVDKCFRMVEDHIKQLAKQIKDTLSILVIGRGYQYATALEGALKLKEITYIPTEGVNAGDLKHGPLALVDDKLTVILICTHDKYIDLSKSALQQVVARKAKPIVIVNTDDKDIMDVAAQVIKVPKTVDCLQTILNVIPLQLLAYHMALLRGNNVDCPRNLAKSVTV